MQLYIGEETICFYGDERSCSNAEKAYDEAETRFVKALQLTQKSMDHIDLIDGE